MKEVQTVVGIIHDHEWFLLLKKQGNWVGWQCVQGAVDKTETKKQAVLREIKEETGLSATIEKQLRFKKDYWYVKNKEKIHKYLTFFTANAKKSSKVILSTEHSNYKWCKKEEVKKLLKYNKDIFEKVVKTYFP